MTEDPLTEAGRDLPAPELDAAAAARIAARARRDLGRRPSLRVIVEPVVIALFTTSLLVWALIRVFSVIG